MSGFGAKGYFRRVCDRCCAKNVYSSSTVRTSVLNAWMDGWGDYVVNVSSRCWVLWASLHLLAVSYGRTDGRCAPSY